MAKKTKTEKKVAKTNYNPTINIELEKYHIHPVVIKKVEKARLMVGEN